MTDRPDDRAVTARTATGRPAVMVVLCGLLWLEVAALVVAAVASVVQLIRGSELPGPLAFLAVISLLTALGLAAASRALWRGGTRWARSPVMFWQILLIVLSASWWGVDPSVWTVVVLVLAVIAAVTLVLRPVVAWTVPGAVPPATTRG